MKKQIDEKIKPHEETAKIKDLKKAAYNPRSMSEKEMKKLMASIEANGLVQPIIVNHDWTIIGGHQRVEACRRLGWEEITIWRVNIQDKGQEKALNLALNKISGQFEELELRKILEELAERDMLISSAFEQKELERLRWKHSIELHRKLIDDYIIPPFSIFDCKQGYWQKRKKDWIDKIGDSGEGRPKDLISGGLQQLAERKGNLCGTSIFDPVLAEVCYTWFVDKGGNIADPFAGGNTRGLVASLLGYNYIGTDVSKEQVQANRKRAEDLKEKGAHWEIDTGANLTKHTGKGWADLIFTCPPYFDLEQYDPDNEQDISNCATYADFLKQYEAILTETHAAAKANAWAVIVIGNVRDKNGRMIDLSGDTIRAMEKAGWQFHNEAVLATSIASAAIRAGRTFDATKKVTRIHQNILFFAKGKEVKINKDLAYLLENGATATAHHDVLIFKKP